MSDLFREVDEAIRQDQLKQLWKKYAALVIVAVVLVVGGIGGWQLWTYLRNTNNQENSDALAAALALGREGKVEESLAALQTQAADTGEGGTATLAGFAAARILVGEGRIDEAVALWDKMAADSGTQHSYRDLAILLSVMHQLDSGDPAALSDRLQPLTAEGQAFRPTAQELMALLALRTGETERAKQILAGLAEDPATPAGLKGRAQQLLSALGG